MIEGEDEGEDRGEGEVVPSIFICICSAIVSSEHRQLPVPIVLTAIQVSLEIECRISLALPFRLSQEHDAFGPIVFQRDMNQFEARFVLQHFQSSLLHLSLPLYLSLSLLASLAGWILEKRETVTISHNY